MKDVESLYSFLMGKKNGCETCRFWVRGFDIDGEKLSFGECRKNPPTPIPWIDPVEGGKSWHSVWPETEGTDFCFQWGRE